MTDLLRYDEDAAFLLADDAATVARIVRTVSAERLGEKRFGEWGAREVIAHVAYTAEVFAGRIQRSLDEENPLVEVMPSGDVPPGPLEPLEWAQRLRSAHGRIIKLLERPSAAERPARHPEMGQVDAGHFAAYQAKHSHEHVAELAEAFPPT